MAIAAEQLNLLTSETDHAMPSSPLSHLGSRRHFLASQAVGIGSLALAWLLDRDSRAAEPANLSSTPSTPKKPSFDKPTYDLAPKQPARPARAQAMISMFMQGGPSHVDMFDPKPELTRRHMTDYDGPVKYDSTDQASRKLFAGPWQFAPRGQCGMELSELLPGLSEVADDICLIRSMRTAVNNHGQSILALQSGAILPGRPSLGSWVTYALGSENQNLPAFVAMTDPGGLPVEGVYNWSNGWLPAIYQGTAARPREPRILNLDPPPHLAGKPQQRMLDWLTQFNRSHLQQRPGEDDLAARIASYELAARMQTAATEALDIGQETAATHRLYGLDRPESKEFGTRCLIARRMIERGVRFVQIYTGNQQWDHHGDIVKKLPPMCLKVDRPAAALVRDLKDRGLLDSTLVHWGGEMGRLPVIQNEKSIGRDHNTYGFSMWLAGGGVKRGHVHGATDEVGHHAVENVVMHYDYHATLLHLFGLDHRTLAFQRPTGPGSLTEGQSPRIVTELLA